MKNYYPYGKVINALECAYVAACKALKLANKFKRARNRTKAKSRVMANLNRIRTELKRLAKLNWPLFELFNYSGCVLSLLVAPVIHSRFLRAA